MLNLLAAAGYLFLVPYVVGGYFLKNAGRSRETLAGNLIFRWVSGQICLWACFQIICVPLILLEQDFDLVVISYSILLILAVLTAVVMAFKNKKRASAVTIIGGVHRKQAMSRFLWAVFWALLLFQLVQAVRMTYADGDDAFYVAVTSITQDARTMYRKLPYTGFATELDVRHGLAPFPVWIAYLAEVTGIRSVSMAHVVIPIVLIAMTYGIFYLLGEELLSEKREGLPLFLIFTQLLVLFGDYSFYTAENFMIARSRQGKAALGNIVIPMMLLLLLILFKRLQEGEKITLKYYILLALTGTTACLCSTLGAMLVCVLAGIAGLCAAIAFKKWKILIPLMLCCLSNVCFAVLYLVLV